MLRCVNDLQTRFSVLNVRMIENADDEFDSQDISHAIVECLHRKLSFFNQLSQRQNEIVRLSEVSLHIQSSFDALSHGFFHVRSDTMFVVEILNRGAI